MVEDDEQYGSGEPRRVEEADISDTSSALIDTTTLMSIDGTTPTSTDSTTSTSTDGTTSTLTDGTTSTSNDGTTSTSTNSKTSTSINGMTSKTIDNTISASINIDFCCRSTPLEIPGGSNCPQDIVDSTLESTDLGQNLVKQLDDDQHTSRKDLETSPKAIIDRHRPPDIDRQRLTNTDRHHPPDIDRCPFMDEPPRCLVELEYVEDRMYKSEVSHLAVCEHHRPHISTEEAVRFHKRVKRIHDPMKIMIPCAVVEAESPIPPDRSMQFSSYIEVLDDHQHVEASQRGLRFRDEVDKGPAEAASVDTDRIPSKDNTYAISNNINKPASIDVTTSPSIDTGRVSKQKELNVCGNLFDGETTTRSDKSGGKKRRNWKKRKRTKGGSQLSLIPHFSDGVRKSRERSRCLSQPFAKLRALLIAEM
uniref:Uncharacterized protein n=1 Tax=Brassica oleracea var. oleracea TaxID=109376 RepID=A0A0D3BGI8_BRAOL